MKIRIKYMKQEQEEDSLTIGHFRVTVWVRTVTTRIFASFPGCEAMIRLRGHFDGGYYSSMT